MCLDTTGGIVITHVSVSLQSAAHNPFFPDYFGSVINILILAARAALSSPGTRFEIRVTDIIRICTSVDHYDRINAVLEAVNPNAHFNSLQGFGLTQGKVVALFSEMIAAKEEIKESYGTPKDAGRSVLASDAGAQMQIRVNAKATEVKNDMLKAGNPAGELAIESGRRGREYVVMNGLIDTIRKALEGAEGPDWDAESAVAVLHEWRRDQDDDDNQLAKMGVRQGERLDLSFCRTTEENTVDMLADGDERVVPSDQYSYIAAYQQETADVVGPSTTVSIYDNGRRRKAYSLTLSGSRAHFEGGLDKLIGILLDARHMGVEVRVLATMPVRISAHSAVVELVVGLASETVFVQAVGKPLKRLLVNEEARISGNSEATSTSMERLEELREEELSGANLQNSKAMNKIYRKRSLVRKERVRRQSRGDACINTM